MLSVHFLLPVIPIVNFHGLGNLNHDSMMYPCMDHMAHRSNSHKVLVCYFQTSQPEDPPTRVFRLKMAMTLN